MAWQARVTNITSIDSNGNVSVAFDIYKDGVLVCPIVIGGNKKDEIKNEAKIRMQTLKEAQDDLSRIHLGDTVDL